MQPTRVTSTDPGAVQQNISCLLVQVTAEPEVCWNPNPEPSSMLQPQPEFPQHAQDHNGKHTYETQNKFKQTGQYLSMNMNEPAMELTSEPPCAFHLIALPFLFPPLWGLHLPS